MRLRKLALVIVSKENNPCQIVDVNVAANWWLNSNNIKEKKNSYTIKVNIVPIIINVLVIVTMNFVKKKKTRIENRRNT